MKRLMKMAANLYPLAWRRRYEAEFAALLEDVQPGWRAVIDVLRGAVVMQMQSVRFWKSVVVLALAGFFVALIPSYWIADQYSASAILRIRPTPLAKDLDTDMKELARQAFAQPALLKLIEKFRLYPEKQGKVPMEALVSEMRQNIQIRRVAEDTVSLQFHYQDRFLAKRVTDQLVRELFEGLINAFLGSHGERMRFTLRLEGPVAMPRFPIYPNRLLIALIGLCVGGFVGIVRAFTRRTAQPA